MKRRTVDLGRFDFATWQLRFRMAANSFAELDGLITNEESRERYLDKVCPPEPKVAPPKGLISGAALLRGGTEFSLDSAHGVYRRQMLVVAGSSLEALFRDFFEKLFLRHPEWMHKFIHPNSSLHLEGMVPLRDIVRQSKEALLDELAWTAARRLSKFSATDALKHIGELTKSKLEPQLLGEIKVLAEQRHRIVHEGEASKVAAARIRKAFKTLELLAEELAQRLEKSGVKVRRDHSKP